MYKVPEVKTIDLRSEFLKFVNVSYCEVKMEKGKNMFTSFVTEESAAPTGSVQGNALGPDWSTGMNLIGSLDVR